jgi:hypothetical protein
MKSSTIIFLAVLLLGSAATQAQAPSRVRGTITGVDGNTLSVKSREGQDLKIDIAPNTTFAYMTAKSMSDIKPGTPLGATVVKNAEGKFVAREVHLFNVGRPIPGEGSRPWDAGPDSMMTNATVSTMAQATQGNEITLTYKGGEQQVILPPGVPIVMAVDSDRSAVVAGEYAYISVTAAPDGKLTATRIQVSRDGVKPPQ